jgi:hypothetical protein
MKLIDWSSMVIRVLRVGSGFHGYRVQVARVSGLGLTGHPSGFDGSLVRVSRVYPARSGLWVWMGESGTGERGSWVRAGNGWKRDGFDSFIFIFLYPISTRTGPLVGPTLSWNGPKRMTEASLYWTDLSVTVFSKL